MNLPHYADLRGALECLGTTMPAAHARLNAIRGRSERVNHLREIGNTDLWGNASVMEDDLIVAAQKLQIPIEFVPKMRWKDALGVVTERGVIKLRESERVELPHRAHVLAHELTHAIFHIEEAGKDPRLEECEAECVAHLITAHYIGCEVADSALYLACHGVVGPTISRLAPRIIADALTILAIAQEGA